MWLIVLVMLYVHTQSPSYHLTIHHMPIILNTITISSSQPGLPMPMLHHMDQPWLLHSTPTNWSMSLQHPEDECHTTLDCMHHHHERAATTHPHSNTPMLVLKYDQYRISTGVLICLYSRHLTSSTKNEVVLCFHVTHSRMHSHIHDHCLTRLDIEKNTTHT